jgi:hypothetical protein
MISRMSDIGDDIVDGNDLHKRPWWSPSSLLTAEAAAITAFTFAVLSLLGGSTTATLMQAILGLTFEPVDYRWISLAPPVVLLLFALGAMLLGGRVIRGGRDEAPTWAGQLARAAVVVAGVGAGLWVVAIVAGLLRGSPGA